MGEGVTNFGEGTKSWASSIRFQTILMCDGVYYGPQL